MINAQKHIKTNNCKTAVNSALANGQHHTELVAASRRLFFPLGLIYKNLNKYNNNNQTLCFFSHQKSMILGQLNRPCPSDPIDPKLPGHYEKSHGIDLFSLIVENTFYV